MIREQPTNLTVLEGSEAKFRCDVIEKRTHDIVFWKKVTEDNFASVLTYDMRSTNTSHYTVDSRYTLTIQRVSVGDEAWYECQAGKDRSRAMLTVNVMMTNMTLQWDVDPPFLSKTLVNLTCNVHHSRPPADITWYHGVTEMTGLGATCKKIYEDNGYGDTISTVTVLVGVESDVQPYRCVATLPNSDVKRTEIIYATTPQGFTSSSGNNLKIYHNLIWILMICLTLMLQ